MMFVAFSQCGYVIWLFKLRYKVILCNFLVFIPRTWCFKVKALKTESRCTMRCLLDLALKSSYTLMMSCSRTRRDGNSVKRDGFCLHGFPSFVIFTVKLSFPGPGPLKTRCVFSKVLFQVAASLSCQDFESLVPGGPVRAWCYSPMRQISWPPFQPEIIWCPGTPRRSHMQLKDCFQVG